MFDTAKSTVVETKHHLELDRPKLLTLLRQAGVTVPDNAGIFVQVPGGGDYSNCTLDIDDAPLQLHWTEHE